MSFHVIIFLALLLINTSKSELSEQIGENQTQNQYNNKLNSYDFVAVKFIDKNTNKPQSSANHNNLNNINNSNNTSNLSNKTDTNISNNKENQTSQNNKFKQDNKLKQENKFNQAFQTNREIKKSQKNIDSTKKKLKEQITESENDSVTEHLNAQIKDLTNSTTREIKNNYSLSNVLDELKVSNISNVSTVSNDNLDSKYKDESIVDGIIQDSNTDAIGNTNIGSNTLSKSKEVIDAKKLTRRNNPMQIYPLQSRKRGEEGEVILILEINSVGKVSKVDVKKGSGYKRLDVAAIDYASQLMYDLPNGYENGLTAILSVTFKLQ